MNATMIKRLMRRYGPIAALLMIAAMLLVPAQSAHAQGCRTFPETGFSVCGRFLQFWSQNGGLPVFGYPISSEQGGIQFFERNRFEAHPENRFPYDVLLGRLGAEAKGQTPPAPKDDGVDVGLCFYFQETGHNLCGDFYGFWASAGLEFNGKPGPQHEESLALFGLPITEAYYEVGPDGVERLVQGFERGVFRAFDENQPPYTVQLDLLGRGACTAAGRC